MRTHSTLSKAAALTLAAVEAQSSTDDLVDAIAAAQGSALDAVPALAAEAFTAQREHEAAQAELDRLYSDMDVDVEQVEVYELAEL